MDIIMIRHGQSEDNVDKVFGTYESPLSEKGIEEINNTKELLKEFKFDKVYYSPFRRAVETFDILALEGTEEARIGEFDFGIFAGLSNDEVLEKHPEEYRKWTSNPNEYSIENGENLQIVYDRVEEFLNEIIKKGESVVLVSHAGIIRIVFCWVLKNLDYFLKFKVENGSINVVSIDEGNFKTIKKSNYNL